MKEIEKKEEENSRLLNNEDNVIHEYTRIYRCAKCKKEVSFWDTLCDDCLYNNKHLISKYDFNLNYILFNTLLFLILHLHYLIFQLYCHIPLIYVQLL